MKLVSFTLQNYRSIQRAEKISLGNLTILIGPNNEGKSNILRGLVTGMEVLSRPPTLLRNRDVRTVARPAGGARAREAYDWERDFPISLQSKTPPRKTVFDYEFELTPEEVTLFKQDVRSNLNGSLPIRLSLGQDGVDFEVRKQGLGAKTLTNKRTQIARFVAAHLNMKDIPTVRTASAAIALVDEMVGRELKSLELTAEYRAAVEQITALQTPILQNLSETIRKMLSTFLPDVKHVEVGVSDRYSALRRDTQIIVDDGTATDLRYKGDGVQSLAAISLIHHISQRSAGASELVLAIEEPEAHLHPRAIHQLRAVLQEIASRQQVILTTHSPLLVNRAEISSNIIVDRNQARRARSIQDIRTTLGVRVSDSLAAAALVLIVEGEADRLAMLALLPANSQTISDAIRDGTLAVESMLGASNLAYKMSQLRDQLCVGHAFLDNDQAGRAAAARAESEGVITPADWTFATSPGMSESELEDLYDLAMYAPMILNRYNIDLLASTPFKKRKGKWTSRMQTAFVAGGQLWDGKTEKQVKELVATLVQGSPDTALHPVWRSSFDGYIAAIESKLATT